MIFLKKVLKLIFIITMILLFIGILFTIIYMNNPIIPIVGLIILVVLGALFDKLFINTKEKIKRLNELFPIGC